MLVIWSQLVDLEYLCLIKLQQFSLVRPCFLISTDLPILKLQRHDAKFQELLMALRWKNLGYCGGWILPFNLVWWAGKALFSVVVQYQASPCFEQGPLGGVGRTEATLSGLPVLGDSAASCEPAVSQLRVGHTVVTASSHGEKRIVAGR